MRFVGKCGSGPSKLLALKSIARSYNPFDDKFGNRPYIWLLERFKRFNVGGRSANHSAGMVSEMLVLEILRRKTFL